MTSIGEDVKKLVGMENVHSPGRNVKRGAALDNTLAVPQNVKHTCRYIPKIIKNIVQNKNLCKRFIVA